MKIAIVDDLKLQQQTLVDFILKYSKEHHLLVKIKLFASGEELLWDLRKEKFDVIFLDIYMNGINGIETAHLIRQTDTTCRLIFSTSSTKHAIESFRVRAFDYLLKPYTYTQFSEVMALLEKSLAKQPHYIEVKDGRAMVKIRITDILYTDYSNHYIYIHTEDKIIKTYMQFPKFSPLLECYPEFLCCYRNCLINMNKIIAIEKNDFVLGNGEKIPIAKANCQELKQAYADYCFDKTAGHITDL